MAKAELIRPDLPCLPDISEEAERVVVSEIAEALYTRLCQIGNVVHVEDLGDGIYGAATREGAYISITIQPTSR